MNYNQNRIRITNDTFTYGEGAVAEGASGVCTDCETRGGVVDDIEATAEALTAERTPAGQGVIRANVENYTQNLSGRNYLFQLARVPRCDAGSTVTFKVTWPQNGRVRSSCNATTNINLRLKEFLERHALECTQTGMRQAGVRGGSVQRVQFNEMSALSKRRIGGDGDWSNHSIGMSIDLTSLTATLDNGQQITLPLAAQEPGRVATRPGFVYDPCRTCSPRRRWRRTTPEAQFEKKFRERMDARVQAEKGGRNCGGGIITCDHNRDHHDHLHLTAPVCPRDNTFGGI